MTTCTDDSAAAYVQAELEEDDRGQGVACKECGSENTYTDLKMPRRQGNAYLEGSRIVLCLDCGHEAMEIFGGPVWDNSGTYRPWTR